ncbi:MAG: hypothetical protein WD015_03665 [Gaiellaceae bacterium]
MKRSFGRRAVMAMAAALCFVLAITLLLVAHDVLRWREAMPAGDVRYRVSPEASDSWQPDTLLPFGAARELLDVGDDVDFRLALRSFRLARLDDTTVSDPEIALLRNAAEARLEVITTGSGDRRRRSRAAGLLGALGLARVATETQDRLPLIESTIASLQLAIALDPENDEAKFNLEVALQRSRGLQLTEASGGQNPTPGGAGSQGAGTGDPGTGY